MNPVRYGSAADVVARLPSPKIWADCPVLEFLADPAKGIHKFDDFKNSTVLSSHSTAANFNAGVGHVGGNINWYAYIESDRRVNCALQADDSGVLMLDDDGSDGDVKAITTGNNVAGILNTPKKGERKKFWFEARFKLSTITTGELGVFVGLAQPGQATASLGCFAGDAAALGAIDYLGFAVLEGDGDDLTIVYNEAGSGTAQSDAGEITLVADTYVRVGFRLDVSTDMIHVYLDGVDQGEDAEIDVGSVNFPSDTDMDVILVALGGTGVDDSDNMKIDWVRFAQEY